jgi:hypothetical protein
MSTEARAGALGGPLVVRDYREACYSTATFRPLVCKVLTSTASEERECIPAMPFAIFAVLLIIAALVTVGVLRTRAGNFQTLDHAPPGRAPSIT